MSARVVASPVPAGVTAARCQADRDREHTHRPPARRCNAGVALAKGSRISSNRVCACTSTLQNYNATSVSTSSHAARRSRATLSTDSDERERAVRGGAIASSLSVKLPSGIASIPGADRRNRCWRGSHAIALQLATVSELKLPGSCCGSAIITASDIASASRSASRDAEPERRHRERGAHSPARRSSSAKLPVQWRGAFHSRIGAAGSVAHAMIATCCEPEPCDAESAHHGLAM